MTLIDRIVDRGGVPDVALRRAIRVLLWQRHRAVTRGSVEDRAERKRALIADLATSPVALSTQQANDQHYEVPSAFFERMLGPHLKYSAALWSDGTESLAAAEEAMLALTCKRAQIADGQHILELGCGWGSLTLYMAAQFPGAEITAVSNSASQRDYIVQRAAERDLTNIDVITADVNELVGRSVPADGTFDRVVSVEMFEHVRNHRALSARIARWLRPGGKLFVHVFAHATDAYPFQTGGRGDWMARHFFTDGLMPSDDLLLHTVVDMDLDDHWVVSGTHYARTLRAWLDRLDRQRRHLGPLLADGDQQLGRARVNRWRVFIIACEELFASDHGNRWHVSHYRWRKRV